jgi:FixJ family two-component response regulator
MESIMNTRPLVSVIDDDESVRESLPHLLKGFGFAVRAFSSAEEFLASDQISQSKCLVVDVNMPGMSGPDLLEELKRLGRKAPVIFITAHRDEEVRSQVLERGAIACLFKPFSGKALRTAIDSALGNG